MCEGIFWYIVRLLLGRRDVTLGKSTPPKGWHFRAFCLIKCHYAALKLFGLSCFQPFSFQAFPFGFGAKKDQGKGFSVLAAREMKQEPRASFIPHPLPALLLTPFFARCLTLVPRSLLLNLFVAKYFFRIHRLLTTCCTLRDLSCMLYFAVLTLARLACVAGGFRREREKRFRAHAGYCALLNAIIKCEYCRHRVT